MSVAYFTVKNECSCCGRFDKEPIGTSGFKRQFLFYATDDIRDFDTWLANVRSASRIVDEYGVVIPLSVLLLVIQQGRTCKPPMAFNDGGFLDRYGNVFTTRRYG